MLPSKRNPLIRLSLLGAALFLGACNTLEPGVDDYSNAQVDALARGPALRVVDSRGEVIGELSDGPSLGLEQVAADDAFDAPVVSEALSWLAGGALVPAPRACFFLLPED